MNYSRGEEANPFELRFVICAFPFPYYSWSARFQRIGIGFVDGWCGFLGTWEMMFGSSTPPARPIKDQASGRLPRSCNFHNFTTLLHQLHTTRRLQILSSSGPLCILTRIVRTISYFSSTLLREFLGPTPTTRRRQLPHHGVAQLQHKYSTAAVDGLVRRRREGQTTRAFVFPFCCFFILPLWLISNFHGQAQLQSQLAQLSANLADTENLLRMTSVQAEAMRGLGSWHAGL